MNEILTLASLLSKTFGKLVQVTVSDTEKCLYADGAFDDSVAAGQPISGSERYFIDSAEISSLPFVVNYKSLSGNMKKLRSSTFFYKDDQGRISYAQEVSQLLCKLENPVERDIYTTRAADLAGLPPDVMRQEVQRAARQRRAKARNKQLRRDLNPVASLQPGDRTMRYTVPRSAMAEARA